MAGVPKHDIKALEDLSIVERKLGPNSVSTSKLRDGSVTEEKLADGIVTPVKIDSGSATSGFVLTANGTGGADWEAPTGGGGEWIEEEFTNVASYDLAAVPTSGTNLELEIEVHGTDPVEGVWLNLTWNGDHTLTNYYTQLNAGQENANSSPKVNFPGVGTFSGTLSAANPDNPSSIWVCIPRYRSSQRKRLKSTWMEVQRDGPTFVNVGMVNVFRATAGLGDLSDPVEALRLTGEGTNITGVVRYRYT